MLGTDQVADMFRALPPETATNGQIFMILQSMHNQLQTANEELVELRTELADYKVAQKEMVATWETSRNVLRLIRLAGGIGTAILAVWGALHLFNR